MDFGRATLRPPVWAVAVFAALIAVAQIPAAVAQDALIAPDSLPVGLTKPDICTVPALPDPDPRNENSVVTSVMAVMSDVPPSLFVYDDRRANHCCILITPPDHEHRISIAARLAVEARFLRSRDENSVRHLNQLIEFCQDEITEAAYYSAYGAPPGGADPSGDDGASVSEGTSGGGGGPPPNPSNN